MAKAGGQTKGENSGAKMRFTLLGCGSSPGVPRIHGEWGACDPANPNNRRLRCSLLVQRIGAEGTTNIVIDTSPDFRQQMLAAKVGHIDGVLYTHPHADHTHGIDDLRGYVLVQKQRMRIYADKPTLARLYQGFSYCFETPAGSMYPPICKAHEISAGQSVTIEGPGGPIALLPILQTHGPINSLGFRFCAFDADGKPLPGGLTYSPDVSDIPPGSIPLLKGTQIWIVDALQYCEHISHFSLEQALAWIEKIAPERAILTHMHIPLDYEIVKKETPDYVEPGFDGMVIELDV